MNLLLLLSLGRLCFQGNTDDCLLVFSRILLKKKSYFSNLHFQANVKETDSQSARQLASMFQPFVESTPDNIVSTYNKTSSRENKVE